MESKVVITNVDHVNVRSVNFNKFQFGEPFLYQDKLYIKTGWALPCKEPGEDTEYNATEIAPEDPIKARIYIPMDTMVKPVNMRIQFSLFCWSSKT